MFELESCNRPKKLVERCCSNLKKKCVQIKAALKEGIELNVFKFEFGCQGRNLCSKEVVPDYSFQAYNSANLWTYGKKCYCKF